MPFSVRITRAAAVDLVAVRAWLTQPGAGRAAADRLRRIRTAIRELRLDPTRWPRGEHEGTRARSVAGHRIVYRVRQGSGPGVGEVDVLRVFGPGQSRGDG